MTNIAINKLTSILMKPTQLVHITNTMSARERKILNILAKHARDQREQSIFNIKISELIKELRLNIKDYNDIVADIESLAKNEFSINILGKVKGIDKSIISLLASVHISGAFLTYTFAAEILNAIHNPKIYAKLKLEEQLKLRSKHALALWEYCNELLSSTPNNIENHFIKKEDIKSLIGIEVDNPYYQEARRLTELLQKTIKHINKETEILISLQPVGKGKNFTGYNLTCKKFSSVIFHNPPANQAYIFDEEIDVLDNLETAVTGLNIVGLTKVLGLDTKIVQQFEEKFGSEIVINILKAFYMYKRNNLQKEFYIAIQDIQNKYNFPDHNLILHLLNLKPNTFKKDSQKLIELEEEYGSNNLVGAIEAVNKQEAKRTIHNKISYLEKVLKNKPKELSPFHKKLKIFNTKSYLNSFIESLEIVTIENDTLVLKVPEVLIHLKEEFYQEKLKFIPLAREIFNNETLTDFKVITQD